MMTTTPIFIWETLKTPVRFYRAPGPSLAMPWHAVIDLMKAARLPDDEIRHLSPTACQMGDDVRRVTTEDGDVIVASRDAAEGLLGALIETGRTGEGFRLAYRVAVIEATHALLADIPEPARGNIVMRLAIGGMSI